MAKKKIKDLTKEEMRKICKSVKYCDICPLSICSKNVKKSLNKEVEVDE